MAAAVKPDRAAAPGQIAHCPAASRRSGGGPPEATPNPRGIPATTHSPTGKPGSTIGAKRLNFCVRDGNRCDPLAIVTGIPRGSGKERFQTTRVQPPGTESLHVLGPVARGPKWQDAGFAPSGREERSGTAGSRTRQNSRLKPQVPGLNPWASNIGTARVSRESRNRSQASRSFSTGQLHTLLRFHLPPIDQVVFLGP